MDLMETAKTFRSNRISVRSYARCIHIERFPYGTVLMLCLARVERKQAHNCTMHMHILDKDMHIYTH